MNLHVVLLVLFTRINLNSLNPFLNLTGVPLKIHLYLEFIDTAAYFLFDDLHLK